MQKDPIFICVESRKGGVGKTTVALTLANTLIEQSGYDVLLIDLDVTGTDDSVGINNQFWNKNVNIVNFLHNKESKKANLVELFSRYMSGYEIPLPVWMSEEVNEATIIQDSLLLKPRLVNLISSFLSNSDGQKEVRYPSNVLFDEIHSIWFVEMLKDLIRLSTQGRSQHFAIIFDNSPGYTGIQPSLEEWLTDIGPEHAKFLFVSSVDNQDLTGTIDSIQRIYTAIETKTTAARSFRNAIKAPEQFRIDLDSNWKKFFYHIAESITDGAPCLKWMGSNNKQFPIDECNMFCSKLCDFKSYIINSKSNESLEGISASYLALLVNKVPLLANANPRDIIDISFRSFQDDFAIIKTIPIEIMPYDHILAAGYFLNTIDELLHSGNTVPEDNKYNNFPNEDVPKIIENSSNTEHVTTAFSYNDTLELAKTFVIRTFQWHLYIYLSIRQLAPTDDIHRILWFEELSPIAPLIGLLPASISRSKAAKLIKFCNEYSSGIMENNTRLVKDSLRRLVELSENTFHEIDSWINILPSNEQFIARYATPILLAACAVNGSLSGTPQKASSQISSNLIRLIAISQLNFHLSPIACKKWLQSQSFERLNDRTLREQKLMSMVKEFRGIGEIKPTATFNEFREWFCQWVIKVNGLTDSAQLLSASQYAFSTGKSSEIIRSAVVREIFRQVLVTGQMTSTRGIELIQQSFAVTDGKEVIKYWENLDALKQMQNSINSIIAKWGLL